MSRRNGKNSKTSPEKIKLQELKKEALELRRDGYTYQQIAEFMQEDHDDIRVYPQKVEKWVKAALKEIIKESAQEVLSLELERLDMLFQQAFTNAQNGDVQSLNACLQIMNRRARYLGIDQPEKIKHEVDQNSGFVIIPALPGDGMDAWEQKLEQHQADLKRKVKDGPSTEKGSNA